MNDNSVCRFVRRDRFDPSGRGRDFHATSRLSSATETSEEEEKINQQPAERRFPKSYRILIFSPNIVCIAGKFRKIKDLEILKIGVAIFLDGA